MLARSPLCLVLAVPLGAQRDLAGTAEMRLALNRLQVTGSALMIAAHPDDENTALLAWLARGRHVRTAYLSLTRGEGGQNLIGPEQGDLLGVIRTQELLAARRIDGAEQFFTRAIDFGYSKTAEETLQKWGRERILADAVWVIRRFRPDVIVLRFSGTPRDGHGHHQSSAMLGKEAFFAAADPKRFPEQLNWVEPWQARRLLWNAFAFTRRGLEETVEMPGRIEIELGDYDPVLGRSYAEIAGMSRSMHRTQGFGAPERRGSVRNTLVHVAGEPAARDLFDGIDLSWNRVSGGAPIGDLLAEAARAFSPEAPEKAIPLLEKARPLLKALHHPVAARKLEELDEAIALCAGLWIDVAAERPAVTAGSKLAVRAMALNRSRAAAEWTGIALQSDAATVAEDKPVESLPYNQPRTRELVWEVPRNLPPSQPFWLVKPHRGFVYEIERQDLIGAPENPPVLRARFRLRVGSTGIELTRPVLHRYVDRVEGERTRPLEVVPRFAVQVAEPVFMFPDARPRSIEVQIRSNVPNARDRLHPEAPAGFQVQPPQEPFDIPNADEQRLLAFQVSPPPDPASGVLRAGGVGQISIRYPHIPPRTVFPPAEARLVRAVVRILAKRIGYVMGAGDAVPDALRQLGCDIALLSAEDLTRGELGRFDAIVTGVRAFNVRPDLRANFQRLLDYVERGGTLVVQYNVLEGGPVIAGDPGALARVGPYPLRVGRDRVSVEEAPVRVLRPEHPLLKTPNPIAASDFEGWVQERGLYFAAEWDSRYEPLFETADPGEKPLRGATLVARCGNGAYVFTAFSWFRQLPAGVPGAFRIFANLLSAAQALR